MEQISELKQINAVSISKASCSLDLGDGSERAEYVSQDYIINKLGRPHRNINIMYTYYPKDKEWPQRISEACKDMEIHFQWDYPYDDYFPYGGGVGGSENAEPFNQIKDIRKHGQDVTLTLTIDCSLEDEYLYQIANDLKKYGRLRLRINHECAGDWFTHNQRYSYKEIADFFVRFNKIIKEVAPNILTVFCAGFITEDGKVEHEEEFLEAYRCADIWSGDCYLALHYGWPFDICEKDVPSYHCYTVKSFYERLEKTSKRLTELNDGISKPLVISEFNTDGDVTGAIKQGDSIIKFAEMLKNNKADWFSGFTLYQFRDRGRLGLEHEDPNNCHVGIEQPLLYDYKKVLYDEYFMPNILNNGAVQFPIKMRWGAADDADGVEFKLELKKCPVFFEISFAEKLNLMIEVAGKWFYKSIKCNSVDLMPAFYDKGDYNGGEIGIRIFAPPLNGENIEQQADDWNFNYYSEICEMPHFRIRYDSVEDII